MGQNHQRACRDHVNGNDNRFAKIARNGKPNTSRLDSLQNVGVKVGHQHHRIKLDKTRSYRKKKKNCVLWYYTPMLVRYCMSVSVATIGKLSTVMSILKRQRVGVNAVKLRYHRGGKSRRGNELSLLPAVLRTDLRRQLSPVSRDRRSHRSILTSKVVR